MMNLDDFTKERLVDIVATAMQGIMEDDEEEGEEYLDDTCGIECDEDLDKYSKEELVELAKDTIWGLMEDDRDEGIIWMKNECDISDEELEYFGVEI